MKIVAKVRRWDREAWIYSDERRIVSRANKGSADEKQMIKWTPKVQTHASSMRSQRSLYAKETAIKELEKKKTDGYNVAKKEVRTTNYMRTNEQGWTCPETSAGMCSEQSSDPHKKNVLRTRRRCEAD